MFRFKKFSLTDEHCGMKICTDSVLLGAWADVDSARYAIDLGAGSGLLSMMLAQRNPSCRIDAVEIDTDACLDARENSKDFGLISVIHTDALLFSPVFSPDLIISNPPYFTSALKSPDASRACARHGAGLTPVETVRLASKWLSPTGRLAMVTPYDGASDLIFEAEMMRLRLRRQCMVSQVRGKMPTRILWEFSREDGPCDSSSISIRETNGEYSQDYRRLTKDFYLNF